MKLICVECAMRGERKLAVAVWHVSLCDHHLTQKILTAQQRDPIPDSAADRPDD